MTIEAEPIQFYCGKEESRLDVVAERIREVLKTGTYVDHIVVHNPDSTKYTPSVIPGIILLVDRTKEQSALQPVEE